MSASGRLVRFGTGGLIGAGLGSAAALLLSPASGDRLRHRLRSRLARAKIAGIEAEAAKTNELVRKFRERVNDPLALSATESTARLKVDQMVAALPRLEADAAGDAQAIHRPGAAGV